jgi:hypothetical protein
MLPERVDTTGGWQTDNNSSSRLQDASESLRSTWSSVLALTGGCTRIRPSSIALTAAARHPG